MAGKLITALTAASGGELVAGSLLAGMASAGTQARKFSITQLASILNLGSLAGVFSTTGAFTLNLNTTAATNSTLPAGTHTLAGLDVAQLWGASQDYRTGGITLSSSATFQIYNTNNTGNINVDMRPTFLFAVANFQIIWNSANSGATNIFGAGTNGTGIARDSEGVVRISNGSTGGGAIRTADPTSGLGGVWKLGTKKSAVVTIDTGNYVEIDIGGTLIKLGIVT